MAAFLEISYGHPGYEAMKNRCCDIAQQIANQFRKQLEPYHAHFESEKRPYFLARGVHVGILPAEPVDDPFFLGYADKSWFFEHQDAREQLFSRGDFKIFPSLCGPNELHDGALRYDIWLPPNFCEDGTQFLHANFCEDGAQWLHAPFGDLYY